MEYFNRGNVKITGSQFINGKQTIPISLISNTVLFSMSREYGAILLNAFIALAGLYGISTFSTIGVIAGVAGVMLGGFLLKGLLGPLDHKLAIETHNGDEFTLTSKDKGYLVEIDRALQEARTAE